MMSKMLARLVVVAWCAVFLTITACSTPTVTVDNAIFDGGEVPQGKKLTHAFILKNAGQGTLKIKIKRC